MSNWYVMFDVINTLLEKIVQHTVTVVGLSIRRQEEVEKELRVVKLASFHSHLTLMYAVCRQYDF